jgi:hypothetical protein
MTVSILVFLFNNCEACRYEASIFYTALIHLKLTKVPDMESNTVFIIVAIFLLLVRNADAEVTSYIKWPGPVMVM